MKIILASASPRRQELIKMITEDIIVNPCDCDETIKPGLEIHRSQEVSY